MIHILLVDDDIQIRTMIQEYAQTERWVFASAENGLKALELFSQTSFDLVVLDVMMPGMDGWSTLKQIRKDSRIPAIMLTARDEEYDRLLGFELGADDYIGKPFSPRELIARMKALLKRSGALDAQQEEIKAGDLSISPSAHQARLDGRILALTPKEYDLLMFMASRSGQAFTRDQLLNHVWGYDYVGDIRTVDTHIRSVQIGRAHV